MLILIVLPFLDSAWIYEIASAVDHFDVYQETSALGGKPSLSLCCISCESTSCRQYQGFRRSEKVTILQHGCWMLLARQLKIISIWTLQTFIPIPHFISKGNIGVYCS